MLLNVCFSPLRSSTVYSLIFLSVSADGGVSIAAALTSSVAAIVGVNFSGVCVLDMGFSSLTMMSLGNERE